MLAVAVGVGATVALMFASDEGSPEGAKPRQAEGAKPEQARADKKENASEKGDSDRQSVAEYLGEVGDIQNGSVEAALESNKKLLLYDRLDAADVEILETNHATLEDYSERVEDLDPPEGYGDQYEVFVLAIDELRGANELAYRLAIDPASATQADFETYDRDITSATAHLRRSNEMLGRDYKTAETARQTSLG